MFWLKWTGVLLGTKSNRSLLNIWLLCRYHAKIQDFDESFYRGISVN